MPNIQRGNAVVGFTKRHIVAASGCASQLGRGRLFPEGEIGDGGETLRIRKRRFSGQHIDRAVLRPLHRAIFVVISVHVAHLIPQVAKLIGLDGFNLYGAFPHKIAVEATFLHITEGAGFLRHQHKITDLDAGLVRDDFFGKAFFNRLAFFNSYSLLILHKGFFISQRLDGLFILCCVHNKRQPIACVRSDGGAQHGISQSIGFIVGHEGKRNGSHISAHHFAAAVDVPYFDQAIVIGRCQQHCALRNRHDGIDDFGLRPNVGMACGGYGCFDGMKFRKNLDGDILKSIDAFFGSRRRLNRLRCFRFRNYSFICRGFFGNFHRSFIRQLFFGNGFCFRNSSGFFHYHGFLHNRLFIAHFSEANRQQRRCQHHQSQHQRQQTLVFHFAHRFIPSFYSIRTAITISRPSKGI